MPSVLDCGTFGMMSVVPGQQRVLKREIALEMPVHANFGTSLHSGAVARPLEACFAEQ